MTDRFNIYKTKITSPSYGIKLIQDNIDPHNLRSLSAFNLFGFMLFTYPKSWNVFNKDFIFGQYILDRNINEKNIPHNLICITNQYYEMFESQFSINKTIRKYLRHPKKNLLLILDKKKLLLKGKVRSLDEEQFVKSIFTYEEIYHEINSIYELNNFQFLFQNSKNLYFQDMAILINEISGVKIKNFSEFFDKIFEFPYLPIWSFFTQIFGPKCLYLPSTEIEYKYLINFFLKRIELKYSEIGALLKKLVNQLRSTRVAFLNPNLRKKMMDSTFYRNLVILDDKIMNLNDELLKNRFYQYIYYLYSLR